MLANRLRWIHWGLIPLQLTLCVAVILYLSHGQALAYYIVLPNAFLLFLGWSAHHLCSSTEIEDQDYVHIDPDTYRQHMAGVTMAWLSFFVTFAIALAVTTIALARGDNYFGLRHWYYLAAFGCALDTYRQTIVRMSR
jgi:hypothetical protein